ncbi:MAG TPA: cell division protein CrgA [Candidatus Stackebrandtia faecavium]|nr:cell division protein CrgA [Candidatus Stackebrandtia faecavium]
MPKSRVRKKKVYTAPPELRPQSKRAENQPSPTWVPVTAVVLIVVGIGWLVSFYLTQGAFPVESWEYWNLAVGFAALVASLLVLSRWR